MLSLASSYYSTFSTVLILFETLTRRDSSSLFAKTPFRSSAFDAAATPHQHEVRLECGCHRLVVWLVRCACALDVTADDAWGGRVASSSTSRSSHGDDSSQQNATSRESVRSDDHMLVPCALHALRAVARSSVRQSCRSVRIPFVDDPIRSVGGWSVLDGRPLAVDS
jgi:hypothetical protein